MTTEQLMFLMRNTLGNIQIDDHFSCIDEWTRDMVERAIHAYDDHTAQGRVKVIPNEEQIISADVIEALLEADAPQG
jgi:hypothetical protein